MPERALMDAPGWYGKLPVLGDFAQRRLPPDFVGPWDDWLQRGIAASQRTLGSAWLDTYLTAHVWHFVLMPGVLGPGAWIGVWSPSVDRVGRYFPFTLAAPLPEGQALGIETGALDGWLQGLEDIARLALQLEDGVDALEAALANLGPPLAGAVPAAPPTAAARLARRETLVELPEGSGSRLAMLATDCLASALDGYSVWWCYGNDRRCGGFAHLGLPDVTFMLKMLAYSPGA